MHPDPDPDPDLLPSPASLQSALRRRRQISSALAPPAAAPKISICCHEDTANWSWRVAIQELVLLSTCSIDCKGHCKLDMSILNEEQLIDEVKKSNEE
ncbi:hypothetical protein ZWY2020_037559 [Hordeum vulgare]|nr:hypothetical protein ZWY2020_037559 [Hordeum vulgare]